MDEILKEFIEESREGLDKLDTDFVQLEENSDDRQTLDSVFRIIHTIKGTCGFLDFHTLESIAHAGENLLVPLRDGTLALNGDTIDVLLSMVDAIRQQLDKIVETGEDGGNFDALVAKLEKCINDESAGSVSSTASETEQSEDDELAAKIADAFSNDVSFESDVLTAGPDIFDDDDAFEVGDAVVDQQQPSLVAEDSVQAKTIEIDPAPKLEETIPTTESEIKVPLNANPATKKDKPTLPSGDSSIRVDVPLLDNLMNLVGELVLARNQIIEYIGKSTDTQVVTAAQRLNLITSELQEGVMQTRMQPILTVWSRLPRVVRDLAHNCGKQVRIEMEGKDTELDKSLIEAIKDPITHLVRNTVDHGIESRENRLLANKSEVGVLTLRAFHEDGQVHIEIADDGAGIDPEKIKRKALELNVITESQAQEMTDMEAQRLIFHAGLSTAAEVTNISGRGVGMDVVKTNIERISGSIDLVSQLGVGTKFIIQVPLTLAIVPALIVTSGYQKFAIPQMSLIELIRIDKNVQSNTVEFIHGQPVFRLRGILLPLVILNDELSLEDGNTETVNIVVLTSESGRFGLVVEHISDTQEIVVKPLVEVIKKIRLYAGAAIMGDGQIALILDVTGIGQRAGIMDSGREKLLGFSAAKQETKSVRSQAYLLVQSLGADRFAIHLDQITRLKQFETTAVESVGVNDVVQYRSNLMPLVGLNSVSNATENRNVLKTNFRSENSSDVTKVVVFGEPENQVGLVVSEILDIFNVNIDASGTNKKVKETETVILKGEVTAIFDVDAFIENQRATMNLISKAA